MGRAISYVIYKILQMAFGPKTALLILFCVALGAGLLLLTLDWKRARSAFREHKQRMKRLVKRFRVGPRK